MGFAGLLLRRVLRRESRTTPSSHVRCGSHPGRVLPGKGRPGRNGARRQSETRRCQQPVDDRSIASPWHGADAGVLDIRGNRRSCGSGVRESVCAGARADRQGDFTRAAWWPSRLLWLRPRAPARAHLVVATARASQPAARVPAHGVAASDHACAPKSASQASGSRLPGSKRPPEAGEASNHTARTIDDYLPFVSPGRRDSVPGPAVQLGQPIPRRVLVQRGRCRRPPGPPRSLPAPGAPARAQAPGRRVPYGAEASPTPRLSVPNQRRHRARQLGSPIGRYHTRRQRRPLILDGLQRGDK